MSSYRYLPHGCYTTSMMDRISLGVLKLVPKNGLSRGVGWLTRGPWPRLVHQAMIRGFARALRVRTDEAELPLSDYETFSQFFVRRLRAGARPVDSDPGTLVSPCDGALGATGRIEGNTLLQAKGRPYGLEDLLQDAVWSRRYENGAYATIYLAPFDYHRVHSPVDGEIVESRHIPGTLWPVNPPSVTRVEDLFAVNERLVTHIDTASGPVGIVMVGATCVGRIRMLYDQGVTNDGTCLGVKSYSPPVEVRKGDELGLFEMGSTVVLLLGPDSWRLALSLESWGERVQGASSCSSGEENEARLLRMGEVIGRLTPGEEQG